MKKMFIAFLTLCSITTMAQDCDKEKLKTLPGNWLPQPGDEVHTGTPVPAAADAAGAKKIFNQVGKLFQQQYKPVGADVCNYLTHNITPGSSAYGNWYIYTISNFMFYCSNGKKSRNSEGLSSAVHINPIRTAGGEFSEIPIYDENGKLNSAIIDNGGFHTLTSRECMGGKLPDMSAGYHIYDNGYDYNLWITYPGKLPFRYVTRKEFLEKQVTIWEAKLKELNQRYSSKAWKEQLEAFPQFKEKMLEDSKKEVAFIEKKVEVYRQDLKKDEAWLNEIAIVKSDNVSGVYRFVFTTPDDGYMSIPIMPSPGYYNRKLPKWAPQFIVINVSRTDGVISQNVRKVVEENIDFFKTLLANNE